jgi:stearoyl-CoA desaturase (delta-9 desaturase)
VSFLVIRLMRKLGIVSSYVDAVPLFRQQLAEGRQGAVVDGDEEYANVVGITDGTAATPLAERR